MKRIPEEGKADCLWDVTDTAKFLNTSRDAVYKLVERKHVPFIRLGRKILFDPARVRRWIDQHAVDAA